MNLKNKAINGFLWAVFDKLINQAGSFILLIYLSRVLSPSDFGLIAMLTVFLAIAKSLVDSGFSQALIQKSSKVTESDLSTVFYVNFIISITLYCLLYMLAPSIAVFYHSPELVALARVLFIVVIINAIALVPRSKLLIAIDFKQQCLINSASMIVSVIVAIYMVFSNYGYWSLVGINLAKALIDTILLLLFSKWYPKILFSKKSFMALFSFGSNLLVAGVIGTTVQNLYSILIGRYFNTTEVGFFQQGFNYTNILSLTLSSVIQGVMYPVMTSIQENEDRLVNMYVKVMGVVTLITFPVFFGFAAIAEEFVLIFLGEKWKAIIPILIILSFARLITPISSLNMNILNARGHSDLFLKTDLIKIPMVILALIVALPYGIEAVAAAQLFSVFVSFFINAYYPGKLFGFGAKAQLKQIFPIFIASIIMYICMDFIKLESIVVQMITKILVGGCVFLVLCWVLRVASFFDAFSILFNRFKK